MTKGSISNFFNSTTIFEKLPYAGETRLKINAAGYEPNGRSKMEELLKDHGVVLDGDDIEYTEEDLTHFLDVQTSSDLINKDLSSRTKEETQKHWSEALKYCNKAIELKPNAKDQYHNRGIVYYNTGFLDEALEDFSTEIEISNNPNSISKKEKLIALKNEAIILHEQGRKLQELENNDDAIKCFNTAIKSFPKKPWQHFDRGLSYFRIGEKKEALDDFFKELEINPNDLAQQRSHYEISNIYRILQDYTKSKFHLGEVIKINNNNTELLDMAKTAKLDVDYLEKEAELKYWMGGIVIALLPLAYKLLKKQNSVDYLSETESTENIKALARNMIEISLKFEEMSQEDRDTLLSIDTEKSEEIFSKIFNKDLNDIDDFITETLEEFEDPNKKKLKELLKKLYSSVTNEGRTMSKRNHVYDKIIKDNDSSKHPIIPKKLEESLKIFRDEAARYMMEIHDQVKKSEVEKPQSTISAISQSNLGEKVQASTTHSDQNIDLCSGIKANKPFR